MTGWRGAGRSLASLTVRLQPGQAGRLVQAHQAGRLGGALGKLLDDRLGRVQVALAPEGGGDDGDRGRDGGEGERQVQAGGERLLDETGEERAAGEVGDLTG